LILLLSLTTTTTWIVVEGFIEQGSLRIHQRKTASATVVQQLQHSKHSFKHPYGSFHHRTRASTVSRKATTDNEQQQQLSDNKSSWSRSGNIKNATINGSESTSSVSRFGVRKRVRAVLEKAKNRTGVQNVNSGTNSGPSSMDDMDNGDDDDDAANASIVAETASIGGLGQDSNFVLSNGSASRMSNNGSTNGSTNNGSTASSYPRNSTDTQLVLESLSMSNTPAAPAPTRRKSASTSARGELHTAQVDAMLNSNLAEEPLEPLPFTLPDLTAEQQQVLRNGERIQEQSKMGRDGSGFVVLDVKAPPYVVWECLLDFEAYPENIGTVRSMSMFTNTHLKSSYIAEKPVLPGTGRETRLYGNASITRAKFVLSKFRLNIAAIHKYRPHPDGHYMVFTLDRACTNLVLKDAKGIWYTQSNPDGRGEEYTRVWLLCEVEVSPMLPSFIVDYAYNRAMPRATSWLKPAVEAASKRFLE
jgi:hypothetical protein